MRRVPITFIAKWYMNIHDDDSDDDFIRFHIEENHCCLNVLEDLHKKYIEDEEPNICNLCGQAELKLRDPDWWDEEE